MQKRKNWFPVLVLILGMSLLGYMRDVIFRNFNAQLWHFHHPGMPSYTDSFFIFLSQWSFNQVYYSKYLLTAIFLVVFYFLNLLALRILFKEAIIERILRWGYLLIILFAGVMFAGGFAFHQAEAGYRLARVLTGILQSPVPFLVLAIARPLYLQTTTSDNP